MTIMIQEQRIVDLRIRFFSCDVLVHKISVVTIRTAMFLNILTDFSQCSEGLPRLYEVLKRLIRPNTLRNGTKE